MRAIRFTFLFIMLCLATSVVAYAAKDPAGIIYYRGVKQFEKGNWKASEHLFQKALSLLKKRKPSKNPKSKYYMVLGQCDIIFHLYKVAQAQKLVPKACGLLRRMFKRLDTVPKGWQKWRVNPALLERFQLAKQRWDRCQSIPSVVQVVRLPKGGFVELRSSGTKLKTFVWKKVALPIQTLDRKVTLRASAPGFLPKVMTVELKRWTSRKLSFTLKRKPPPKPRVRVSRYNLPDSLKAPKKSSISPMAIVIVGVGTVVAAATVTTILLLRPAAGEKQMVITQLGPQKQ